MEGADGGTKNTCSNVGSGSCSGNYNGDGIHGHTTVSWAAKGAAIGGGIVAAASVVADAATGGLNIPATPAEVAGGAAAGAAVGGSAGFLVDKMAKEVEGITHRVDGPEAEQYSLRANSPGNYPNVRGGTVNLAEGDVWKYGQTTLSDTRYSRAELGRLGLTKVVEFRGSQKMALIQEKLKIYGYMLINGSLPPGNSIAR